MNMKKSTIITALIAIMMMAVTPAFAQEENGFKKFNVREDFTENGFQWFHDAELLAAGDKWEIFIPAEMGYGKFSQPGIPGGSTLIFEIELLGIA